MTRSKKIFIICPGLGRVNRGYESFARQLFDNLKEGKLFELFLVKGGGFQTKDEFVVWSIYRNTFFAKQVSKLVNKDAYWVEQFTFTLGLVKTLFIHKPELIYYSDFILGTFLWHLRRIFGFKYILLFSNGAPNKPPFTRMDHVQQLLPKHYNDAIQHGYQSSNMTLLQYAFEHNISINKSEKDLFFKKMNLPTGKKVILSVGALNSSHKRMDYVINEFINLKNRSSYFLVLLGQFSEQTDSLIEMCKKELNSDEFSIQQTDTETTLKFMNFANYFILASFSEGLPRVLPEALFFGLMPIVHNYDVTKQTLGNFGIFRDLSKSHQLQSAIDESDQRSKEKTEIIESAVLNYSWNKLLIKYVELINYCLLKYAK